MNGFVWWLVSRACAPNVIPKSSNSCVYDPLTSPMSVLLVCDRLLRDFVLLGKASKRNVMVGKEMKMKVCNINGCQSITVEQF